MSRLKALITFGSAVVIAACSEPTVPEPTGSGLRRSSAMRSLAEETPNHIVLTSSGTTAANLQGTIRALGARIERSHDAIGVLSVSGLTDETAAQLEKQSGVMYVERDASLQWVDSVDTFEVMEAPSGPEMSLEAGTTAADPTKASFYPDWQWNMRQIDAHRAWTTTDQGSGALVCVLDTGIDPGHQDLVGKVTTSVTFVPAQPINDQNGHGTSVASIISSNGLGVASVAPGASLCAVKVLGANGRGQFDWIIAGIMYATDRRADVINMSLGAYIYAKRPSSVVLIEALQRALDYASNRGTLVITSSGNNGLNLDADVPDSVHIPSQLQKVISVGATGPFRLTGFDAVAAYSNRGTTGVDMTAPGGSIVTGGFNADGIVTACSRFRNFGTPDQPFFPCAPGNFYLIRGTGTSFASPHVAGAAAVFATNTRALGGDNTTLVKRYDARFLEGCLEKGLDRIDVPNMDVLHGKGRLNVEKSMLCGSSPK